MEMNFDALVKSPRKHRIAFEELSKFPEVKRDLALLVDRQVTFAQLRAIALATERKLLKSVSLFDVYEGDKLPEGKKSYALSFVLEDKSQTLTDKAIERVMNNLQAQFERQAGAVVRKCRSERKIGAGILLPAPIFRIGASVRENGKGRFYRSSCLAFCQSASCSSGVRSESIRPCPAAVSSIAVKRRMNLRLVRSSAASGSTP